jgi:tetratricopeptide (TPR) repeat protein
MMRSNITLAQSYELFGLKSARSIDEIKQIYRQIAKQIHPDLNPQDPTARDRFNHLNQAYQLLLVAAETAVESAIGSDKDYTVTSVRVNNTVDRTLSSQDLQLKQTAFDNLQKLISQDDFIAAVLTIDRLVSAIPNCMEISKKQSEVYFKYAQDLIKQRRQINVARNYLKASLKIDPHNQQRWEAVNREFNRIERMIE